MNKWKPFYTFILYLLLVIGLTEFLYLASESSQHHHSSYELITKAQKYNDQNLPTAWEQLLNRVQQQPFNLLSFIIFVLAIFHTLFAHKFTDLSHKLRQRNIENNKETVDDFAVEILNFLGEVEVIFGIWVIPLCIAMSFYYDWSTAIHYLNSLDYKEPLFVVVVMTLASTRPIIKLTEDCLLYIAKIGGGTVKAWWWTILTIGPIAGSFVTEPGAMTISAIMLGNHFYKYKPNLKVAYATLGLLFVNISVGGVLTSFAAPPVLMVSAPWGWSTHFMATNFGWKAVLGIFIANALYYFLFKQDLESLEQKRLEHLKEEVEEIENEKAIPLWITIVNITFLAWTVVHSHSPVIFIGSFLLFLGFQRATLPYQTNLSLRLPILVGFFLSGLIVHGNLQGWWISPILGHASDGILMIMSATLTTFTDNAEITFLASLIPSLTDSMKYAIVAGAITGGGLTVIANAPNPLGQALLGKYFHNGVVSAGHLFLAAIIPTIIMAGCFWTFKPF
ncbi:MAG: putative Na+/H+ antiporter [Chlamydiota bacterium]|nr:putative Na+/H+ antiporter [Chlamydiota bacterium]